MKNAEWERMCECMRAVPDTLTQVDRAGRIIAGPWDFRTGRERVPLPGQRRLRLTVDKTPKVDKPPE